MYLLIFYTYILLQQKLLILYTYILQHYLDLSFFQLAALYLPSSLTKEMNMGKKTMKHLF